MDQALRTADNTAPHKERAENCRAASGAAVDAYRPGTADTRRNEPSTADHHLSKACVLTDGSIQFGAIKPAGDATTGAVPKDAAKDPAAPKDAAKDAEKDAAKPKDAAKDPAPKDAATPDPARKDLPKTAFGKEMDDRYKDKDLTSQQRDFLTRIADGAKNTDDPAQKERMTRWMDRDVDGLERANGTNRSNADNRENGWKKDPADVRNKADSGYDKLSPEQKSFVNSVAGEFPHNTYQQQDRDAVTRAAIDRSQKGDLGGDAAKEFTKTQKEGIESALAAAELNIGGPVATGANVVDKSGQASDAAHLALRAATSGVIAENGAVGQEANVVGKVLQAIPGAENLAGTALKYAPIAGKVAPYVAGAGFAAAGVVEAAQGHIAEGANTGLKGGLSVGATVLGSIACGGPETPIGIACGAGAGLYTEHAYETFEQKGMAGFGELAREPGAVSKAFGKGYMKSLTEGQIALAGYPITP